MISRYYGIYSYSTLTGYKKGHENLEFFNYFNILAHFLKGYSTFSDHFANDIFDWLRMIF